MKQGSGDFIGALLFLAGALVLGAVIGLLFGYAARKRDIAANVMTRRGG